MKTTVKLLTAATLIALVFPVMNLNAKGIDSKNSFGKGNETAFQNGNQVDDETLIKADIVSFEELFQDNETEIELENWMTDSEIWNLNIIYSDETETGLNLENWMIISENWNTITQEKDEVMTLENWMFDSTLWN